MIADKPRGGEHLESPAGVGKHEIGDLIEIEVPSGRAYALFTHSSKMYGALVRVFPGIHQNRPEDVFDLVHHEPLFSCFFPLSAAVKQGRVAVAGKFRVPDELAAFPVFRAGMVNPATGKVDNWWLWDGENETRIGHLTPEQRKLDIRGVWNDTLLIERIEKQWNPEQDTL
ncbi:hypothetical protein N185_15950 [Sinorhizobium sp. GW3]|nr:hypothetical protein N185_15950 [Sinorhizobium sp. GW3]